MAYNCQGRVHGRCNTAIWLCQKKVAIRSGTGSGKYSKLLSLIHPVQLDLQSWSEEAAFHLFLAMPILHNGAVTRADQLTQRLLAFEVPAGTTSIHVKYSYTGREVGNAIDLGLLEVGKQFRDYSGGSKFEITVSNDEASGGYIAGLLPPGEWYVLLGIYDISSRQLCIKLK
jgi:hypothetical protein